MGKVNARLDAARKSYREALEAARTKPSPEAWARLLAAGKDLSAAEEPRQGRSGRRPRRAGTPTIRDLEGAPAADVAEVPGPSDLPEVLEPVETAEVPDPDHHEFEHAE